MILKEYEENFNKIHSFNPKLTKKPKNFSYSIEKLYDDKEAQEKKNRIKQVFFIKFKAFLKLMIYFLKEIEENRLKECVFQPEINKKEKFSHVTSNYSDFQNVQKRISLEKREKNIKILEIKKYLIFFHFFAIFSKFFQFF